MNQDTDNLVYLTYNLFSGCYWSCQRDDGFRNHALDSEAALSSAVRAFNDLSLKGATLSVTRASETLVHFHLSPKASKADYKAESVHMLTLATRGESVVWVIPGLTGIPGNPKEAVEQAKAGPWPAWTHPYIQIVFERYKSIARRYRDLVFKVGPNELHRYLCDQISVCFGVSAFSLRPGTGVYVVPANHAGTSRYAKVVERLNQAAAREGAGRQVVALVGLPDTDGNRAIISSSLSVHLETEIQKGLKALDTVKTESAKKRKKADLRRLTLLIDVWQDSLKSRAESYREQIQAGVAGAKG